MSIARDRSIGIKHRLILVRVSQLYIIKTRPITAAGEIMTILLGGGGSDRLNMILSIYSLMYYPWLLGTVSQSHNPFLDTHVG
jgi:hypothetical protein